MKKPFSWDHHSDQPYQLTDRAFKKAMRRKELGSLVCTFLSTLLIAPFALLIQTVLPKRKISTKHFFGMSIDLEREPEQTRSLIDELDVDTLLVRFKLWEMGRLDTILASLRQYRQKKIILNIMQDREHIADLQLLKDDLSTIFEAFGPYVTSFQIGTTINRAKWGFFSVHEYLRFFQIAYRLKREKFHGLTLLGPSVIDFEYHFTIHALFNFFQLKYDGVSALLYVDRRGAPEQTQMGYDLISKIDLLDALTFLSPKSRRKVYITETNWPISDTAPYAPTSEHECVDEESYADFMVRYCLLAFASQKVDAVYWHQLIAPGYGLIDSRQGLRKRSAFYAFKTMLNALGDMELVSFSHQHGRYTLKAENRTQKTTALWSMDLQTIDYHTPQLYTDRDGQRHQTQRLEIGPSPIYFIEER